MMSNECMRLWVIRASEIMLDKKRHADRDCDRKLQLAASDAHDEADRIEFMPFEQASTMARGELPS